MTSRLFASLLLAAVAAAALRCSGSCPGRPCPSSNPFTIKASECITSIASNCPSEIKGCGDAGTTFGLVTPRENGGTCDVTTTLQSGKVVSVQVQFTVTTPATECCPAIYDVQPPSIDISGP